MRKPAPSAGVSGCTGLDLEGSGPYRIRRRILGPIKLKNVLNPTTGECTLITSVGSSELCGHLPGATGLQGFTLKLVLSGLQGSTNKGARMRNDAKSASVCSQQQDAEEQGIKHQDIPLTCNSPPPWQLHDQTFVEEGATPNPSLRGLEGQCAREL